MNSGLRAMARASARYDMDGSPKGHDTCAALLHARPTCTRNAQRGAQFYSTARTGMGEDRKESGSPVGGRSLGRAKGPLEQPSNQEHGQHQNDE